MKGIPIGVDDFKELREKAGYYVDKTPLIADILESNRTKVFHYIRPRRFGKSLNLSMLDAYLNMKYVGNTWFEGLTISEKRPNDPLKNSYPVIELDFKRTAGGNYEEYLNKVRIQMMYTYSHFEYLVESEKIPNLYKDGFTKVINGTCTNEELSASIQHLCEMLELHHGRKAVILIDEYDSPLNTIYGKKDHEKVLAFIRDLLSNALKGNDSLEFAVVTGVMQISKESIFSGLNNVLVNNVFSTESDEMFGFTANEVMKLCEDHGHPEKYEEARQWYDGYVFGNAEIYNPWSILNYVRSGFKPDEYWAGTSGNSIISTLLDKADKAVYENLNRLGSGSTIDCRIDPRISYADMETTDGIYSVMVLTGYLKAVPSERRYLLSIPNDEMYGVFAKMIADRFDSPLSAALDSFCNAVISNDPDGISNGLSSLMMEILSSRVLDHEHSYQAFTAGILLNLHGRYSMFADGERGKGFYDILLESNRGNRPHILMEFKKVRSNARNDTMRKVSRTALEQIRDRRYFHGLKGDVLLYGVAVRGKDVVVTSDLRHP